MNRQALNSELAPTFGKNWGIVVNIIDVNDDFQ